MLPLKAKDRVRMLSAVSRKGALYQFRRVATITLSLLILLAIPLTGLFRIDLWGGNHLLLNEPVGLFDALKGFVVAMAILYGFTFLTNMVFGRFFCGWGCPVGYVSRLGEEVDRNKKSLAGRLLHHALGAGFVATFVGSIMLWWVDPMVMIDGSLKAKLIVTAVFLGLSFGGFLHAFVWRFLFCIKLCPIGIYYQLVTSKAPVGIVFNEVPSPCIECGACETICPVYLDPKALGTEIKDATLPDDDEAPLRYGDAECIRCGDCVEACNLVFKKRVGETPPLRFGKVSEDASHQRAEEPAVPS